MTINESFSLSLFLFLSQKGDWQAFVTPNQLTTYYLSILLLQSYFQKNGYAFNAFNNVWDFLCNTDVITFIF